MKVYIAGPMRGIPLYNFPAFDHAAGLLSRCGLEPVSPADLDRESGFCPTSLPDDFDWSSLPDGLDIQELFDRDMDALRQCDAIWLLPGWRESAGATAEYHAARWLGIDIMGDCEQEPAMGRKQYPMARGLLDYFPDALAMVWHTSFVANEQHNPGEPMHWAREKSTDHADCIMRHLVRRGTADGDGLLHIAKVAWRALAMLQLELEQSGFDL